MPAHYMITKIDPLTVEYTRNARMAFAMIVIGIFLTVFGAYMFLPKRVRWKIEKLNVVNCVTVYTCNYRYNHYYWFILSFNVFSQIIPFKQTQTNPKQYH